MSIGYIDLPLDSKENELLGIHPHIKALGDFILQCNTPMTIAIQGDWGTGKTSMMNLVREFISEQGIKCIWFNTWQYSQFDLQDDVPLSLLLELSKTLGYDPSEFKKFIFGLFRRAAIVTAGAVGGADCSTAVSQATRTDPVDIIARLKELKDNLDKLVEKNLKGTGKDRIVIFIDDLDRMTPAKAVELLEMMKNFLDIKGCVFVLAVDYSVVSRGVREKYGADIDEVKGRSFFDKIIQLPFNLPVGEYNIGNYLKHIFNLNEDETELDHYVKLANYSVSTNPRALKRMANILTLLEIVAKNYEKKGIDKPEFRRALFAVLCLQLAYPPVYAQMLEERLIPESFWEEIDIEDIKEMFAKALEECPGQAGKSPEKKEELPIRLKKFFEALSEALKNNGIVQSDIFNTVLNMSGITAAGSQAGITITDAQKERFDPLLFALSKKLHEEITKEYKSLWELLKHYPEIANEGQWIKLPVNPTRTAIFVIGIYEEGITLSIYTNKGDATTVKYPIRDLFTRIAPDLMKNANFNGKSKSFLTFPTTEWREDISNKSEESSNLRFKQLRNYVMTVIATFLPGLEKAYQQKNQ